MGCFSSCNLPKRFKIGRDVFRKLTLKLAMLLALTSAARAHEICFLNTKFLVKHHSGYSFHFNVHTKMSKPGKIRKPLVFVPFEEKDLCVCHTIDLYLDRTSQFRVGQSQLLLSYIKPH